MREAKSQSSELTAEQRLYLEIVLRHFRRAGDWPILRDVQREMAKSTEGHVDVLSVLQSLPVDAQQVSPHLHNPAILNIPALALGEADEEISDLLSVIQLAVEKYFGNEPEPTISSEELANSLRMSELRIRKALTILNAEPAILGGGSSPQSEGEYSWTREVSDHVGEYKSVQTVDEYLEARNRLFPSFPAGQPIVPRRAVRMGLFPIPSMAVLRYELERVLDEMENWSGWIRVRDAERWIERLNSILAQLRLQLGEHEVPDDVVMEENDLSTSGKTITDAAFRGLKISAKRLGDIIATEDFADTSASLSALHADIRNASEKLFLDGHRGSAVFEAFKAVNLRVKRMTGLQLDGKRLMAHVFDEQNPVLRLNPLKTQSHRDEQEGFKFIYMGVMLGIRNPKAHDELSDLDVERAHEYLALASLLMRRLDDTERVDSS